MASSSKKIVFDTQSGAYSFGDEGFRYLTAGQTSPVGEVYHTVFANEAAEVSMTSSRPGTASVVGMPIPTGSAIYGCLSAVTCTSGKVTCYLKEDE